MECSQRGPVLSGSAGCLQVQAYHVTVTWSTSVARQEGGERKEGGGRGKEGRRGKKEGRRREKRRKEGEGKKIND
jgi:hypothetical protein